jgi:hypothetical protein
MLTEYLFTAQKGDIHAGPDELTLPFKISLTENHPFLTLGDYFDSIRDFILRDHRQAFENVLRKRINDDSIGFHEIEKVLIRSEKHGALYHLASVGVFTRGRSAKLAVSTAISEDGKLCLAHEFDTLRSLNRTFNFSYVPEPYLKGEINRQVGAKKETLAIFMTEWFEDYHEWHLSYDENTKERRVCIWDLKNGHRFATRKESFEIFRQASKILTLYYDTQDFSQIYPWHHAAGDFVIKSKDGVIEAKLASARQYKPVMAFMSKEALNPMISLVYFFLDLTMRMRLDKLDGIGETAWADGLSINATTTGFFDGLLAMESEGRYHLGNIGDLLYILKGFSDNELRKLYDSLLDLYRYRETGDLAIIRANLDNHISRLHHVVQKFRL